MPLLPAVLTELTPKGPSSGNPQFADSNTQNFTAELQCSVKNEKICEAEQGNNINAAINQLYIYANDLGVLAAYLAYDVRDKQIDAGWSHPLILQALADIQGIELYIWQPGNGQQVIPHQYHSHCPVTLSHAV